MGFLIDTCIWIDVERGVVSPSDVAVFTGNEPVYISPVTIVELTFGAEMAKDEGIRQKRLTALSRLRKKPACIIDESTGEIFGRLTATIHRSGKPYRYRIQDLWLASQAIQNNYKLLTGNIKDFLDIPGLDLVAFSR
ncbi:MAG: type II toxin-antitoxin system VapC family toxin [Deltaproteobacteria bacterium]|nr:type II toxin-antitoxin system VapC family toxin [Deltaproteobacteria bacterium]